MRIFLVHTSGQSYFDNCAKNYTLLRREVGRQEALRVQRFGEDSTQEGKAVDHCRQ